MDLNTFTNSLKTDDIETLKSTSSSERKGICLFVSFDLDNSTSLKMKENSRWPSIIMSFYEIITKEINEEINGINIWKYLGDEVLFYYNIKNIQKIYNFPEKLHAIQKRVKEKIACRHEAVENLDIKCTVWIAGIRYVQPKNIEILQDFDDLDEEQIYRNIRVAINQSGEKIVADFLGPDIDTGFRIAKYSNKRIIALSAEYAYLLYHLQKPQDTTKIDSKLKIIAFKKLKGIWDGRTYPIIWYHENWGNESDIFDYDEHMDGFIINDINKKDIKYIEKIFETTGKKQYMNDFLKACMEYKEESNVARIIV